MKFFEEYSTIIGLLVLTFVIVVLFSTQSMIFAKSFTAIDTELARASGDAMQVRTKMDLGSDDCMNKFPTELGHWKGSDYYTANLAAGLGADVMLMRAYISPESYRSCVHISVLNHINPYFSLSSNRTIVQVSTRQSSVILLLDIQ
jgi:hypothetical protein